MERQLTTKRVCTRCGKPINFDRKVVIRTIIANFCPDCHYKWWDLRDKLVGEAFERYIRETLGTEAKVSSKRSTSSRGPM